MKAEYPIHNGGVLLPAVSTLTSLPSSLPLFNTVHGLRAPLGIYNTAYSQCVRRLQALLITYTSSKTDFVFAKSDQLDDKLIGELDAFLDSMMEYMEDCENILLCFFETTSERNKNLVFKTYKNAVQTYRRHIGLVVNHIKHTQGRIRLTSQKAHSETLLGYFVEGADADGSIGPERLIHANDNAVFSLHRDLRYHLVFLYIVSTRLSEALKTLTIGKAESPNEKVSGSSALLDVTNLVASMPKIVFTEELRFDSPRLSVVLVKDTQSSSVRVEYPCPYEKFTELKGQEQWATRFEGDGATTKVRFPGAIIY
ncbi:MAG: hypothetical protein P4L53_26780 [Candidatus Obscuribacterales bacterium]|nr:hypothetical protein [Candidatus Obscuribacterales bacterium]